MMIGIRVRKDHSLRHDAHWAAGLDEKPLAFRTGVEMTDVIGSGNGLRFAAALVVCLVRELANELSVLNGTAANFHSFASVGTDHLFAESAKSGAVNRATANSPKMADFMCGKYARLDAFKWVSPHWVNLVRAEMS
jgi:hypothetical protein